MSFSQKLASEQYFNDYSETETKVTMIAAPAAERSATSVVRLAGMSAGLAIVVFAGSLGLMQSGGKAKSNPAADFFLWITGSNLTWEQYQRQQRARGNQRLDETKYDWQQQLLNDAYSRSR